MTEQPVETEEQFLGNAPQPARLEDAILLTFAGKPLDDGQKAVLNKAMQHYAPNAHRQPRSPLDTATRRDIEEAIAERVEASLAELPASEATFQSAEPDLWFEAEKKSIRATREIQDGNVNAGIAFLQAALAFAQNYRHSLAEEVAR